MKKFILLALIALFSSYTYAQLTYMVKVPAGTKTVYLRGDMNGWGTSLMMNQDQADVNLFTITVKDAKPTHGYKYCSGPDWAYEELTSTGNPPGNRTYPGAGVPDVVAKWRMIYDPAVPVADITLNATVPVGTKNCYVVGSFNSWSWNNPLAMKKIDDTHYTVTIPNEKGISYKYTSGSNSRYEEVNANGSAITDRMATPTIEKPNTTTNDVVAKWKMQPGDAGDIMVDVLSIASTPYMTINGGMRTVRVYMPNDYKTSTDNYPVLYMLDGQNIFSPGGPYGSWDIDAILEEFHATGNRTCIIVGIDNSNNRMDEYNPLGAAENGADNTTLPFIVNTLKPYIDTNYRTLSQREFTGLGGSSLGGITSLFGVLKYQDVFSKGCIFSPSYWYNYPEIFTIFMDNWTRNGNNQFRLYQIGGTQESETMVAQMQNAAEILSTKKGFTDSEIKTVASPTMMHNEASWRAAFLDAFKWLWNDYIINGPVSVNTPTNDNTLNVSVINRQINATAIGDIHIYNITAQSIASGRGFVVTNPLHSGVYLVISESKTRKIVIN